MVLEPQYCSMSDTPNTLQLLGKHIDMVMRSNLSLLNTSNCLSLSDVLKIKPTREVPRSTDELCTTLELAGPSVGTVPTQQVVIPSTVEEAEVWDGRDPPDQETIITSKHVEFVNRFMGNAVRDLGILEDRNRTCADFRNWLSPEDVATKCRAYKRAIKKFEYSFEGTFNETCAIKIKNLVRCVYLILSELKSAKQESVGDYKAKQRLAQAEKALKRSTIQYKALKLKLRQYITNFEQAHKRRPVTEEDNAPTLHLYVEYNRLKSELILLRRIVESLRVQQVL